MSKSVVMVLFLFFVACGSSSSGGDGTDQGNGTDQGDNDATNSDGGGQVTGSDEVGDGKCGKSETPVNSPQDCPAIIGDGFCSTTETPASAPTDCPAVLGDHYCSSTEDAESAPADCPAIAGDGYCSANETYVSAPTDCPAPSYTLTGGNVDTLRNISPSLTFDVLTITGTFTVREPASVTLSARQIIITTSGEITLDWPGCDYSNPGDIQLIATESVRIEGAVNLDGKDGTTESSNSTTSCSDCTGASAADLLVRAPDVAINTRIDATGGNGGKLVFSDGSGSGGYSGCDGAEGGTLTFDAKHSMTMGGTLYLRGGLGGVGQYSQSGDDGPAGSIRFLGLGPTMSEQPDYNGDLKWAQIIPVYPMTMSGHISKNDDARTGDTTDTTVFIGSTDRIEDLFIGTYYGTQPQLFEISLTGTSGTGDIDLWLLRPTNGTSIANSSGSTNNERLAFTAQPNTTYVIGINAADDAPSTNMDYTFQISMAANH